MCTEKSIYNIERELKTILNESGDLSEKVCGTLVTEILELFEKRSQELFMEGYRYAISVLEDGIVDKQSPIHMQEISER